MAKKYYAKKAFSFGLHSYRVGEEVSVDALGEDTIKTFIDVGILSDKPVKSAESGKAIDEFGIPLGEIDKGGEKNIEVRAGVKPPAVDGEILGTINEENTQKSQEEAQENEVVTNIAGNEEKGKETPQESQEEAQSESDYEATTKKQLIEILKEKGIEVPKKANKAELIELIKGAN